MHILITGATGFVGGHLCSKFLQEGHVVRAAVRRSSDFDTAQNLDIVEVGDIGRDTDWKYALKDIDIVIHTAARTHIARQSHGDCEALYWSENVEATEALAIQAVGSGVHRFIFLSSVKAGGESSEISGPLCSEMLPTPEDAYGRTKLAAEDVLFSLAGKNEMEVVVLRAPLIYGPGIKGNLLSLFSVVNRGIPLPLKWTHNRRDLLCIFNLLDAVGLLLQAEIVSGRRYYICDGEPISTPELIRRIADALDRPVRLFPVPVPILRLAGRISGCSSAISKLTKSLEVDGAAFCREVGWSPPFQMKEGLAQTAAWYKSLKA